MPIGAEQIVRHMKQECATKIGKCQADIRVWQEVEGTHPHIGVRIREWGWSGNGMSRALHFEALHV